LRIGIIGVGEVGGAYAQAAGAFEHAVERVRLAVDAIV